MLSRFKILACVNRYTGQYDPHPLVIILILLTATAIVVSIFMNNF